MAPNPNLTLALPKEAKHGLSLALIYFLVFLTACPLWGGTCPGHPGCLSLCLAPNTLIPNPKPPLGGQAWAATSQSLLSWLLTSCHIRGGTGPGHQGCLSLCQAPNHNLTITLPLDVKLRLPLAGAYFLSFQQFTLFIPHIFSLTLPLEAKHRLPLAWNYFLGF